MRSHLWMRRFDFDVEIVVRLSWSGVEAINLPAKVRYFTPAEGGVSHFNYLRDNVLLTSMHARLFAGFLAASTAAFWHAACEHGGTEGVWFALQLNPSIIAAAAVH